MRFWQIKRFCFFWTVYFFATKRAAEGSIIMSNRLFQGVVHQMRDTIDRVVGVIDDTAMDIHPAIPGVLPGLL